MSRVRELARERGIITIVVLHDISLACRWADRVVVLSRGEIAAVGSPSEAVTPDILARVYGVEARVETCSRGVLQVLVDNPLQ
jgi:iron complex transport system ATP-binding protein